jgi:hypothetical protein
VIGTPSGGTIKASRPPSLPIPAGPVGGAGSCAIDDRAYFVARHDPPILILPVPNEEIFR